MGSDSEILETFNDIHQYVFSSQAETCKLVPLKDDSFEWKLLQSRIKSYLPNASIQQIQRIQNPILYSHYQKKVQAIYKDKHQQVEERLLSFSTWDQPPSSVYQKIKESFSKEEWATGGLWGKGIYFTDNISHNDEYAYEKAQSKQILFCRVAIGQFESYTQPKKEFHEPPILEINSFGNIKRYDSVKGTISGMDMFVVYSSNQAYPCYLVTYL